MECFFFAVLGGIAILVAVLSFIAWQANQNDRADVIRNMPIRPPRPPRR